MVPTVTLRASPTRPSLPWTASSWAAIAACRHQPPVPCSSRQATQLYYLTPPRSGGGGSQRSGRSPRLGAVAAHQPADPGRRDVRTCLRKGCRQNARVPFGVRVTVTTLSSTFLMVMVPVGWRQTATPPVIGRLALKAGWSPRPDSNRGPFPYQGNALPPELRGRADPKDYCLRVNALAGYFGGIQRE